LKKPTPKNLSASVHQRLLNIARDTGTPFNEILQYFAMERMLHRLSCSSYADSFVLKGALLFRVWDVPDSRATRDIDLLAYVDNSAESLASIFRDVVAIDKSDGLVFDPDSVAAQTIKEDADYEGVRVRFRGLLGKARITMQIDVGFGDKVHPDVVHADYPAMLDMPAPSLRMYPPETVVAEKAEAMVHLGSLNSRMKDFYDIWRMSQQFEFHGDALYEAVRGTFENRGTEVIEFDELALDIGNNENFGKQWNAFLQKSKLAGPDDFAVVLASISEFLAPVFKSILKSKPINGAWRAGGPWNDS
jgi:hypothetical protein